MNSSKDLPVLFGDRVILSCSMNSSYYGNDTNISVRWTLNGTTLAGIETPTLVIAGVLPKYVGLYECSFISNCGNGSAALLLHTKGELDTLECEAFMIKILSPIKASLLSPKQFKFPSKISYTKIRYQNM